jgi:acyl-CoA thioesterase FadM
MLELDVRYGAEAFWGECLRIEIAVSGPGTARCEFAYRVDRDGTEVLRARALMGFFDYAARRLVRRPADFLNRLTTLEERNHV